MSVNNLLPNYCYSFPCHQQLYDHMYDPVQDPLYDHMYDPVHDFMYDPVYDHMYDSMYERMDDPVYDHMFLQLPFVATMRVYADYVMASMYDSYVFLLFYIK